MPIASIWNSTIPRSIFQLPIVVRISNREARALLMSAGKKRLLKSLFAPAHARMIDSEFTLEEIVTLALKYRPRTDISIVID